MIEMQKDSATILSTAKVRGGERDAPYEGVLLPAEAHQLCAAGEAHLVDVRTQAEWSYVGQIPYAIPLEWQSFPGMEVNAHFGEKLIETVPQDKPVFFICRSGVRSHYAATVAGQMGYAAYNIMEGFEGELNEQGHRNTINGWRARGLPWTQT